MSAQKSRQTDIQRLILSLCIGLSACTSSPDSSSTQSPDSTLSNTQANNTSGQPKTVTPTPQPPNPPTTPPPALQLKVVLQNRYNLGDDQQPSFTGSEYELVNQSLVHFGTLKKDQAPATAFISLQNTGANPIAFTEVRLAEENEWELLPLDPNVLSRALPARENFVAARISQYLIVLRFRASDVSDHISNTLRIRSNAMNLDIRLGAKVVDNPIIEISSLEGLHAIRNDLQGNYRLTSDIDLRGTMFQSIGVSGNYDNTVKSFSGILDGQGYKIHNGRFWSMGQEIVGLVGNLTGQIKNIEFQNIQAEGRRVGLAAAVMTEGSIENIEIDETSRVRSSRFGGSLVGDISPMVSTAEPLRLVDISSKAEVVKSSSIADDSSVGGLIGITSPFTSTGTVYQSPENGPAVVLRNARFEGEVILNTDGLRTRSCGGIAGSLRNTSAENLSSNSDISGQCSMSGGIAGELIQSQVTNTRFSGKVFCTNPGGDQGFCGAQSNLWSGGIVGRSSSSTVDRAVFTGEVRGIEFLGGIVGLLEGPADIPNFAMVTRSFSSGSVVLSGINTIPSTGRIHVGGIFGGMGGPKSSVEDVASQTHISAMAIVTSTFANHLALVNVGGIGGSSLNYSSGGVVFQDGSGSLRRSLFYGSLPTLTQSSVGGVLASNPINAAVESSYWNSTMNSALQTNSWGTALSTDQMMTPATFGMPSQLPIDRWHLVEGAYPHLLGIDY